MIEKNSVSLLLGARASVKFGGPTMNKLSEFVFKEPPNGYIYNSRKKRYEKNLIEYKRFTDFNHKFSFTFEGGKIYLRDVYSFLKVMIKFFSDFSKDEDFKERINHEHFLGALNFYRDKIRLKSTLVGSEDIKLLKKHAKRIFNDDFDELVIAVLDKTEDIIIARIHLYFDLNMNKYNKGDLAVIEELIYSKLCSNIITLNYDFMIEELIKSLSLSINDGFIDNTKFVEEFNTYSYSFKHIKDHVSLFKLHGSFDYMTYFFPKQKENKHNVYQTEIVKFDSCDKNLILDIFNSSKEHRNLFSFANLIIDGYSKEKSYFSIYTFRRIIDSYIELKKNNTIIIVGYGFGDYGINSIILNWLNLDTNNNLFIIDPYINLSNKTLSRWDKSENLTKRIHIKNIEIEGISYNELLDFINN